MGGLYLIRCGMLLFYLRNRQCEKPEKQDKADTVPTPFLLLTTLEGTGVKNIYRYESKEFIGGYDGCGVEFQFCFVQ